MIAAAALLLGAMLYALSKIIEFEDLRGDVRDWASQDHF